MIDGNELLDLVDKNDKVIGTIHRKNSPSLSKTKLGFIRASTALIQNDKGELWIPRRAANKHIAPNGLDSSMQEHVGSGESYLQAAVRGFKEELNIAITPDQLQYIGTVAPNDDLYYFVALYVFKSNVAPKYNESDFVDYEWIRPEELARRLISGEQAKTSLLSTVNMLLKVG